MLLVNDEQCFFYSDESEPDEARAGEETLAPSGWWARLDAWWRRFQKHWHEAEAGVTAWSRRTWHWLHSRIHPDESMLVRLRTARRIDLHHPAARSADDVAAIWRDYLGRRLRRHVAWLILNAIIAPLTALLTPLPGPNVIGFWFAYRTIHHWLVVMGIRKTRR